MRFDTLGDRLAAGDAYGRHTSLEVDYFDLEGKMAEIRNRVRAEQPPSAEAAGRRRPRPGTVIAGVCAVVAAAVATMLVGGGDPQRPTRPPAKPAPAPAAKPAPPDPQVVATAAGDLAASAKPGEELGRVVVQSVGYEHALVQGAALRDLKRNAGHYVSSVMPGQPGTVGVAARLESSGQRFGPLGAVDAGDMITLKMPYATFDYRVSSVREVPLRDTTALRAGSGSRIVLTAVHGKRRLVIAGTQIGVRKG